ncbi:MAG: hypothetical protein AUI54_02955 [Acidobacteria bacterium 13_1_40CM_2_56_5]|nr:MAG: hypothetical protein AUI54_02955 [Acidobacteria bacterium 13_1_40CM_2_56_5]
MTFLHSNEDSTFEERREFVRRIVEERLAPFAAMVEESPRNMANAIVFHQGSFAADLDFDELVLLGAAIKFAGERGFEIHIPVKNPESLQKP